MKTLFALVILGLSPLISSAADSGSPDSFPSPRGWSMRELGQVPVQSGGRIKPLDAFSRDLVLFVTGSRKFKGWDPVEMVLSWTIEPLRWADQRIIQITRVDVRRQLLLEEGRKHFSPGELLRNPALLQYADRASQPQILSQTPVNPTANNDPRGTELRKIMEGISVLRSLAIGDAWPLIPRSEQWEKLTTEAEDAKPVHEAFSALLKAYQSGEEAQFQTQVGALKSIVESRVDSDIKEILPKIRAEVNYIRLKPYFWSAMFYLVAGLLWAFAGAKPVLRIPAGLFTWIAFGFVSAGLGLRSYIAGRPPVSNMYESVVWVSFGVIVFTGILYFIQKQKAPVLMAVGSFLSVFGLFTADAAPAVMDPSIHPLVPVLRDNFWLTTHVLTITLGYSAFALALGIGNVTLYHYWRNTAHPSRVDLLNQLTYRAMQFGVVLLAAGTILGGVWADYSWGRFWGWDPKETWALIALLCYVAILHARYTGWVSTFSFAAWSVISFLSVVMAWYGVNFVLGAGLHAYGFSSGGFGTVALICAVQAGFVLLSWYTYRARKGAKSATSVMSASSS